MTSNPVEVGTAFDRKMMRRCIELAQKAAGRTAPNPMVGAVVVKDGEIIGEGFHPGAGKPHAEVFALREAGDAAKGATIYVSLEPCNHYGRTPPCSLAVVKAGLAKVVVGMVDPDPRVSGGGIKTIQDAGIETLVGVEEVACQQLNEGFIHRILQKQPLGILKYAMTLDGKIATTTGHSAWITHQETRNRVYELRSVCDAVIVGGNTVRLDNPHLTTHDTTDHNPLRVIVSQTLDFPKDRHLWDVAIAPTVVITKPEINPEMQSFLKEQGVEIAHLDLVSPKTVMQYLYERGCLQVLWECGGTLSAQAIAEGTVQKVMAFIAPKIIGGKSAPTPVGDLGLTLMDEALVLEQMQLQQLGEDFLLEGRLVQEKSD
ncbi:diaminohydroxyphosphoribosylaminopyrimidine deaminase [[Leptolyngbya] sp. PCC 7376]|uniref:bifunctional diaminohydroxyphosphoribosylaminopyrimidine deaminase/5-amino-6-(5-phosphoribosylamino)uracil reductase RibD n=1 Tax=[Leptolyngbya] sp. PCC 7376 TaxID=111781 RepID=UPI00029F30AC|nr:bifunctional diaminohydroxyphosphoribosylaminopyrimidine deaminase/5-amino-6-(5-phosphoribosylamino)uracil reductase RibD [[Leptolyngbya] sp. PCC 7376]AFY36598.1 diaminohydroxyphosphoribosylaminopyrimidine deaminase [[Leptolyngbya] sp. PCC 7376]